MAGSLPLIPEKRGAVCADVRPLLREVFRECECLPPLTPRRVPRLQLPGGDVDTRLSGSENWIDKYDSDLKEICDRESELKQQYARRISREPLRNIYKLQPPIMQPAVVTPWRRDLGVLDRRDLAPTILQNSDIEETLWVRNILNRSSSNFTPLIVRGEKVKQCSRIDTLRDHTVCSVSMGSLQACPPAPGVLPPAAAPAPVAPACVCICVPPHLDFVNFTVGRQYSQYIRIVNVCKWEVRLSVRPPASRQLSVELVAARGLTVTSGAAAHLKVHFRARDVRAVSETLLVRVSSGQLLQVPISCYMQPPVLDILVPAVSSSIFSCTPGDETKVTFSSDCLELGARLLGDDHCVPVMFYCEADHAAFFLLTEDAWLSFNLDVVTSHGSLVAPPFSVSPAWWAGGGRVKGRVWCRAARPGLQHAALRLLASTGVVRPLHLIADVIYYTPRHITLQAHEKDYDICSEDDPACVYYVNLGTAFPRRSLSASVQLVNHSPVSYSYYWSVRPWGVCSCWQQWDQDENNKQEERDQIDKTNNRSRKLKSASGEYNGISDDGTSNGVCRAAQEARDKEQIDGSEYKSSNTNCLRVEPARGSIAPRSSCDVHVCVTAGDELNVQRAVLMLILKDVPKECLPKDYDPMIVKTDVIDSDPMPGVEQYSREICEIVHLQMEVWWEVAPVRFVIDPPSLRLDYSRRVKNLDLTPRATQLFGCENIRCSWKVPDHVSPPPGLELTVDHSCAATLRYHLPELPNDHEETDIFTLEADQSEWCATSEVHRRCATRHPALRPARRWLGVLPPRATVHATLHLYNDTHHRISWCATPYRWHGESPPSVGCSEPCTTCHQRQCSCNIIRPTRGVLRDGEREEVVYSVHAPQADGCVCTLVQARRTDVAGANAGSEAGSAGRASLLAYRVLAPRLVLRVLPCHGDKHHDCEACALDEGAACSERGTAMLRPRAALPLAHRACYRLCFTNLTPLPTAVTWDPPLEEDALKVTFIPNDFKVGGYGIVTTQSSRYGWHYMRFGAPGLSRSYGKRPDGLTLVPWQKGRCLIWDATCVVVEGGSVSPRHVFVYRALVAHAHRPLYLVIDTAVAGLEITCEIPVGGDEESDTVIMRRTQAATYPWQPDAKLPHTFPEIFAEEDRKRAVRNENICRCKCEMQWTPAPAVPPAAAAGEDYPPIEIVLRAPPLSRVCTCCEHTACDVPRHAAGYSLQYHRLPLHTVVTRTIVIRNESPLPAAWSAAVRRWPWERTRALHHDEWSGEMVCGAGVRVQCAPCGGVLRARARATLAVRVCASSWGLYRDQLAIKIENLEAIVVDVWVEAVGAPLHCALTRCDGDCESPTLWMSRADPERVLRVRNTSCARLLVHACTITHHEHVRDTLPFRLYMRMFDLARPTCVCMEHSTSTTTSTTSASSACVSVSGGEETATGLELFLGPDCGLQTDQYFKVSPSSQVVVAGAWSSWHVQLQPLPRTQVAPPGAVLLRPVPLDSCGVEWCRLAPPPQLVEVREARREGALRVSREELRVALCALHLPPAGVMRVRKRFHVQNVGNGQLELVARTEDPWSIVVESEHASCDVRRSCCTKHVSCGSCCTGHMREQHVPLRFMPRSSLEMCVEVCVSTTCAAPPAAVSFTVSEPASPSPAAYEPLYISTTDLRFYDQDNIIESIPLVLELEYPMLSLEPALIDFGFVTDGDTRKSYYSVTHSSLRESVEVVTQWEGGEGFTLSPPRLLLAPRERQRIYIQYTSKWCGAPVEGRCVVRAVLAPRAGGATGGTSSWCRGCARARASPTRDVAHHAVTHDYTDDTRLLPLQHSTRLCL